MTTSGTVVATIAAGVATDAAGNGNTASTSTDNTVTFNAPDTTPPSVTINQAATQADPASSAPINFTVVFIEPGSGFTGSDVTITGTAGGAKTVTVSGSGSSYTAAVSGFFFLVTGRPPSSPLFPTTTPSQSNTASTSTDNTVTFNAADTTPPSVTINQAATQADPTSSAPINFTVVFSEPVSGFAGSDVTITGTAGGAKTVTVSGSGSSYTAAVSGMTTSGTVVATIAAGVATDAAGNGNTASTRTDNTVTFNAPTTPPPTTRLTPAGGPVGTSVTISGTNFTDATAVTFNGVSATFMVRSATTIEATVPGGATTGAIGVTTPGGTATSASGFTVVSQTAAATRVENPDPSILYTPGTTDVDRPRDWWQGSRSRDWSGRTASFNRSAGARATFPFTGTAVSWVGFRAPWAGIGRVYLDGAFVTELDLYAPTEQTQTPVFSATGLASGAHTLVVESTGRKNAASIDYAVVVDAFDVAPPSPPPVTGTRVDETSPSVSYTTGWTQGDPSAWSGGTAATATTAGSGVTVSFVGTSVSWVGFRGPQTGIAQVFLDGALQAEVDTYSPTAIQAVGYTASDLTAAGQHTLTEMATSLKDAAARD